MTTNRVNKNVRCRLFGIDFKGISRSAVCVTMFSPLFSVASNFACDKFVLFYAFVFDKLLSTFQARKGFSCSSLRCDVADLLILTVLFPQFFSNISGFGCTAMFRKRTLLSGCNLVKTFDFIYTLRTSQPLSVCSVEAHWWTNSSDQSQLIRHFGCMYCTSFCPFWLLDEYELF